MSFNPPKTPNSDANFNEILDSLLFQSFLNRAHPHPSNTNSGTSTNDLLSTVLTPSLPLISSSPHGPDEIASSSNGPDESRLGYVAMEEAKVEAKIVRIIHSGDGDLLRPNSGQPVTIGGHSICVGFRDEMGSEYRVWEWHGHVSTRDEENCYSLEYIFGNYFEKRR
ncbi:FK506-binding protein 5-like protein [Cinnamomum micranthum f. kanehirae]|uniref:FK506-binding protein 5-like protein n=1 Tax=Cinnamomum micranthum f. kanehirae TaxID=337451 RepID=A0A443NT20_9MAGN|nr:FK506-binding protein 5-like protein [Cinnamomum micranthum f. kanehirae]